MGIFSWSRNNKEELTLVFNIGSSAVGAALFYPGELGVPKIIFSATEPIPMEEKLDADKFLMAALKSLDIVAARAHDAKLGAPMKIFGILSSPWYMSETRIIKYKKNTPFVFTEKLADELITKEIKLFGDEYLAKYPEGDNAIRAIELKNLKTVLNGYETPEPLDRKASELEMHIFVSVSGEQVLGKIEDIIGKYFAEKKIKFSSFAMASFTVVRDMHMSQHSFLLVDIGGELTDVFMAKKNVLRESISFPLGRNFLIRGISEKVGCTLAEAQSLLSLYKDGHAEKSLANKLGETIDKLKKEWLNQFQLALANLSKDISIPSLIYIIVDKDMVLFFSEIIKYEQFSQYTLTESKFEVSFLGSAMMHGLAKFEENVIREPFLIIDAVYVSRFLASAQ